MHISVHGISLRIEAEPQLKEALQKDFAYFVTSTIPQSCDFRLEIQQRKANASLLPNARALNVQSEYVVYEENTPEHIRTIDYHGRAVLKIREKAGEAQLWCEDPGLAHELAYLYLQSQIASQLESRGWHRIHALAYLYRGKANLVLIPSGGGKSTLALALLQNPEVRLLSDDCPIVDRAGRLHPYPLRLAFRSDVTLPSLLEEKTSKMKRRKYGEKKLLGVHELSGDLVKNPLAGYAVDRLIVAHRHGSLQSPVLQKIPKARMAPYLFRDLVVGVGLPQLAEILLSRGWKSLPSLSPRAISRSIAATQLLGKASTFELCFSNDSAANAEILLQ
jgi:hypothetical protein